MWRGGRFTWLMSVLFALIVAGCAEAVVGDPGVTTIASNSEGCELPPGEGFIESETVDLAELGEVDGAVVHAALYPHPDYEGNPWSQWGQGIALADGRFYSAIGDHIGSDGNSYIYEYDPASHRLTMVGDILSYVDHVPGTWGYGKVHSQMVNGPCGEIYFSTYWGTSNDLEFEGNYTGDIIFRLDPNHRTLSPLSVPVDFHGQASLGSDPGSGLIFGEAVDPILRDEGIERGPFFAYDVQQGETVFRGPDEPHVGYRAILVDATGAAYYSIGDNELQRYDPTTGESEEHDSRLPGKWLRATTAPAPDGTVYGVTREPDRFFALDPDGSITDLGEAVDYTASITLSPDGSTMYYLPGAHGGSPEWGSPLIAVDTDNGEQTTVAELNELVENETGYTVGGTYNIAISPDGRTIYMGVNVGRAASDDTFGEVMLLVIELP